MSLEEYSKKRDFTKTPEPSPGEVASGGQRFFLQRHDATQLHYDFRLEIEGVLKSWAVPKGPTLDPTVKVFAALVEDHPIEYGDFEGNIPKGAYGGGSVMLWDRGTFELIGDDTAMEQLERGDLKFRLHGEKLRGTWAIVRMKTSQWLLIKKKDEASQAGWNVELLAYSIKTGRSQEEIAAGAPARTSKTLKKKYPQARLKRPCRVSLCPWARNSQQSSRRATTGFTRLSGTASVGSFGWTTAR